jgi:hypothetical protein
MKRKSAEGAVMELLEQQRSPDVPLVPPRAPSRSPLTEPDERGARTELRRQIARLERELASLFVSAYPREGFDFGVAGRGGPRILSLGELEQCRDELDTTLREARAELSSRAELEVQNRVLIERMLAEPERYKFVRVRNADIGEPGCKQWHVRPRFGLLGMFLNWWQVKLSSGCPLARGARLAASPPRRRN